MNSKLTSFPGSPFTVQMEWSDLNHEVVHLQYNIIMTSYLCGETLTGLPPDLTSCAYVISKG